MRYDAALLDIDGTLINSNDAHASAWVDALAAHGRDVPFARVRPLIGMGGDKLLRLVAGLDSAAGEGKVIADERRAIFTRGYLPRVRAQPGAEALLTWLRERRLTLAVATSAQADEVEALLAVVHAVSLAPQAAAADAVDKSKPDPDVVHAALARTRSDPRRTVMMGDTPYDIEAAARAGVDTIAFTCGGWTEDQLRGAIAVYRDPAALIADIGGSPFFAGRDDSLADPTADRSGSRG
jgi:HAD superfamily hydrolase (TIGR01509 family)